jgi:serine/threonine protein kinase
MSDTSPIESHDGRIAVQHADSRVRSGVGESSSSDNGEKSIGDRNSRPLDSLPGQDRTLLLNLALEAWCRRKSSGSPVSVDEFVAGFPDLRHSLENLIRVHDFIEANPDLIDRLVESSWPVAGDDFCGFDLLEELGRGASSRVFLAREPALANRLMVVKVGASVDREASGRGALVHPSISPIYSTTTDTSTGLTALVMPFQSRITMLEILDRFFPSIGTTPSLTEIVEHIRARNRAFRENSEAVPVRPFPADYLAMVLDWAIDIAGGLDAAHSRDSTHGDIKPSNILVTDDARAVLIDFNLSQSGATSKSWSVGGTLPYMAPEQIRALLHPERMHDIDPLAADIFQFGATFAHIASGVSPLMIEKVAGNATARFEYALERRDFDRMLSRVRSIPMRQVLERCLSDDAAVRPASGRDLLVALEAVRKTSRPRDSGMRRPRRWMAMIALASSLVVPATWFATGPSQDEIRKSAHENDFKSRVHEPQSSLATSPGSVGIGVEGEAIASASRMSGLEIAPAIEGLAEHPDGAFTHAVRAYSLLVRDRDAVGSIRSGEAALAKGMRSYAVLNNLGLACIAARNFATAELYLVEATELNTNDHRAWWSLAVIERDRALKTNIAPRTNWIDHAMKCDAPHAGVFLEAALQYAMAARSQGVSEQHGDESLRIARLHLTSAAALGASASELGLLRRMLPDPLLDHFRENASLGRESGLIARAVDPVAEVLRRNNNGKK